MPPSVERSLPLVLLVVGVVDVTAFVVGWQVTQVARGEAASRRVNDSDRYCN
jgi:hypothetical protein